MQQLLDIIVSESPSFSNFVIGQNGAVFSAVQRWSQTPPQQGLDSCLYLWGNAGSGGSHLLISAKNESGSPYLSAENLLMFDDANFESGLPIRYCIDHIERTQEEAYSHLFRWLRKSESHTLSLLLTGNVPPRQLKLPPEITSRIGKMQIFQLLPLSDEEKKEALQFHAKRRGMLLDNAVLTYFLQHMNRDIRLLTALITAFDEWCLQNQCAHSLPMARRMLTETLNISTSEER